MIAMAGTGLYDISVAGLVRESLQHVWSVEFRDRSNVVIPLNVSECSVTFDEDWWPYVQGEITAVIPDQAILDRLDPRKIVKCTVRAGYVLPSGVQDLQPLAVLYLSGRAVNRPDNTVTLSVQGQEYILGRATPVSFPDAANPFVSFADAMGVSSATPVRDAIDWCLREAGHVPFGYDQVGIGWDYANASDISGWSGNVSPVDERYGADVSIAGAPLLGIARDIANLTGCWLRCDETGLWRCTGPRNPPEAGALWYREPRMTPASAALSVGSGGTIIESVTGFDRDSEWANMVAIHFTWETDSTGKGRWGFARVTGGDFAVQTVGVCALTYEDSKPYYVSQATANQRAAFLLQQALNRGRTIELGAVAAYWLRPRDVVTVQLPLGPQERHDLAAVTYVLHEGRMSVRTKLPDTTSQITLGGS